MPWLGYSLGHLGSILDLQLFENYSQRMMTGFTFEQVKVLWDNAVEDAQNFAAKYSLVHGDLYQKCAPNNIVFHPIDFRLYLIDAEALNIANPETTDRFINQMNLVKSWTNENLVIARF